MTDLSDLIEDDYYGKPFQAILDALEGVDDTDELRRDCAISVFYRVVYPLMHERDEARNHVEKLQAKIYPDKTCACSVDRPGDVCLHHSPLLAKALKERDEALAEVARLRAWIEAVRNNSALMAHAISERDRADKTERERDEARAALHMAVETYGQPGGPWNVPSDPGGWLHAARKALKAE